MEISSTGGYYSNFPANDRRFHNSDRLSYPI